MTKRPTAGSIARRPFLSLSLAPLLAGPAFAQPSYPGKPVRFVIPFSAGSDQMMRVFLKSMSDRTGQPFVVDYKPGAATNIGAAYVAQSAPDGYTLFLGTMASNALNKLTYKNLSYDSDAFTTGGMIGIIPSYLLVRADSPFQSVKDLVQAARQKPGGLSYGTHGIGGPNHLVGELFRTRAGIKDLVHVAYRGLSESSVDLLGGRIDFMWDAGAITLAQQGKLRALGVAHSERWPTLPNVPTMAEAGYPDVTLTGFYMVTAPAGTPAPVLDKLNELVNAVLAEPEFKSRMLELNILPRPGTRQEAATFVRQQTAKWAPIIKSLNISLE